MIAAADRGGTLAPATSLLTLVKAVGVPRRRRSCSGCPRRRGCSRSRRSCRRAACCSRSASRSASCSRGSPNAIGLAPIVGAFAAGLILEEVHYRDFTDRGEHGLEELIHPISVVPRADLLRADGHAHRPQRRSRSPACSASPPRSPLAAILGKQACSLGVIGKGVDRLTVGIGMIPRGEVGLIFANIGLA